MKHILALKCSVFVFLVRITILSLLYTSPNGSTCTLVSRVTYICSGVNYPWPTCKEGIYRVYLCMRTLVVHLGQGPIVPGVSGEEYGVLFPRLLF